MRLEMPSQAELKHQIRSLVLCVDLVGSSRIWLLTLAPRRSGRIQ